MAFGPMSVGSEGALNLITDPTLSKENASADAKAVGDALGKKFDKSGGTVNGKHPISHSRRYREGQEDYLGRNE